MRHAVTAPASRPAVVLLSFLAILLWLGPIDAVGYDLVVTNTNDSGAGSLRKAILDASAGQVIGFNLPGTGPWTITLSSRIGIYNKTNLSIVGPGSSQLTVRGNGTAGVFFIDQDTSISFSHMTITGGVASSEGGGGFAAYGFLNLQNCIVTGNQALGGGGIFLYSGASLTVTSCEITANQATDGSGGGIETYVGCDLTISNSTIADNTATNYGGGLRVNLAGAPSLTNTTISGNQALYGGGIYYNTGDSTTLTLTDCIISSNTATNNGGGIYAGGPVSLTRCTISANSAGDYGGGIYGGTLADLVTMTDCALLSNTTTSYSGGGAYITAGLVSRCEFSGNHSGGLGGGLAVNGGQVAVINSTFSANLADVHGGGISFYAIDASHYLELSFCTVTGNRGNADGSGTGYAGGLYHGGTGGSVRVKSTAVASNMRGSGMYAIVSECYGTFESHGYSVIARGEGQTGFSDGVNNDQVGTLTQPKDPLLGPLADNGGPTRTCALLTGSPAINTGGPATAVGGNPVTTDQRGERRPQRGAADIGAYEVPAAFNPAVLLMLE